MSVTRAQPRATAQSAPRRPNVILLYIDDLAYGDVGAFGAPDVPTPHIDSLAAEGVRCTWSYIPNPPCSPSRVAMFTGMYAQRTGRFGMGRGIPIPEAHPTFAETMRDAGYVTGTTGKWDLGRGQGPLTQGFLEVPLAAPRAPAGRRTTNSYLRLAEDGRVVTRSELEAKHLIEFVGRHAARADGRPFYFYFSPFLVHTPLSEVPQRYLDRVPAGIPEPRRPLAGALIQVDETVGRLRAELRRLGIARETLVIFTSDNGGDPAAAQRPDPFRGGKGGGTQYEGWVHVPTIFTWPGGLPAGQTYAGMMANFDFYATAAAAAGAEPPAAVDGVNLLPYLRGETAGDAHEWLFWYNVDPEDPPHRHVQAVRWRQWRLVLIPGTDRWRLHDLHVDPREERDLAAEHPDLVARMRRRHAEWVATLPPVTTVKDFADYEGPGGDPPVGWGWTVSEGWPHPDAAPETAGASGDEPD